MSATILDARTRAGAAPRATASWGRWTAIAFVGALGVCLPAWHVVTALLSDSYMTLYTGRWIAQHGIPHHEVFTLGAQARPWVDQQWLAELIDYEAWRMGGYGGLGLLNGIVIGGAYAGLAAIMLRRGASVVLTVACCAEAMFVAVPALSIRAQDLALPLLVILFALCLKDAGDDSPRWRIVLVLPLLVLWANLHGSVLLGAGLACAYLIYRGAAMARRGQRVGAARYGALAVLAALTPLATPYGLHTLSYYPALIGNSGVAAAAPEDRPPNLSDPSSLFFLVPVALTLAALLASAVRRRRVAPPLVGAALLTGLGTLMASRNVVWFGMSAAVLLASVVQAWVPTRPPARAFLIALSGAAAATAVVGIGLLLAPPGGGYERYTPLRAMSAAATYAARHPEARILGDNAASSALLWHYPQLAERVAFDARLERYSAPELERWITYQLGAGPHWRASANGYQLLLGSTEYNPALVRRLASAPGTSLLAIDAHGIAVVNR